jgi:hypothetical protein
MEVDIVENEIEIMDSYGYAICITRDQALALFDQLAEAINKIGVKI